MSRHEPKVLNGVGYLALRAMTRVLDNPDCDDATVDKARGLCEKAFSVHGAAPDFKPALHFLADAASDGAIVRATDPGRLDAWMQRVARVTVRLYRDCYPEARRALVHAMAWKCERLGLDDLPARAAQALDRAPGSRGRMTVASGRDIMISDESDIDGRVGLPALPLMGKAAWMTRMAREMAAAGFETPGLIGSLAQACRMPDFIDKALPQAIGVQFAWLARIMARQAERTGAPLSDDTLAAYAHQVMETLSGASDPLRKAALSALFEHTAMELPAVTGAESAVGDAVPTEVEARIAHWVLAHPDAPDDPGNEAWVRRLAVKTPMPAAGPQLRIVR